MCSPSAQPPTQPTPPHTYRDRTHTARVPNGRRYNALSPPFPSEKFLTFIHYLRHADI